MTHLSLSVLGLAAALAAGTELEDPLPFVRGDANSSLTVELTDAVTILGYLFLGEGPAHCLDAFDVDDNGHLEVTDPVSLLGFLFLGEGPPPAPFPEPGRDLTLDGLICSLAAPPGGSGPVRPEEHDPAVERAWPKKREFGKDWGASNGLRVSLDLFEKLLRIDPGKDLRHFEDTGIKSFVGDLHEYLDKKENAAVRPFIRASADGDGCYAVEPWKLLTSDMAHEAGSSGGPIVTVEPELICGVGPHVVEVTVEHPHGKVGRGRTVVSLEDGEVPEPPPTPSGSTGQGPRFCVWIYAFHENPKRAECTATRNTYNEEGRLKKTDEGNTVALGDDPVTIVMKRVGAGLNNLVDATRQRSLCSTPDTNRAHMAHVDIEVKAHLLCFQTECVLADLCEPSAYVEGWYEGFGRVAAHPGKDCSFFGDNKVEAVVEKQSFFRVGETTGFNKGLSLHRGNKVTETRHLHFSNEVSAGPKMAASLGVREGYSRSVRGRTGRAESPLAATGGLGVDTPARVRLETKTFVDLWAEGSATCQAQGFIEAGGVTIHGKAGCPSEVCSGPFFFWTTYGRGKRLAKLRRRWGVVFRDADEGKEPEPIR